MNKFKGILILLDNGHGKETPGKRSPDLTQFKPTLYEWEYTRKVAREVHLNLQASGIKSLLLVMEDTDVPLSVRCSRANKLANTHGIERTYLVSIHLNAHSKPEPRGWEVHTYLGQSESDKIATVMWEEAKRQLTAESKMRGDWSRIS